MMRALRAHPGQLWVLGGTALVHCGVGFVPLFGGPGYEAALALGIILPLPVACVSAARALDALRSGSAPLDVLAAAVRFALLVVGLHLLILLLHGARVGYCGPLQGVLLFALGPGAGAVLGAAWGSCAGLAVAGRGGRVLAVALAGLGPLGGIVVSVWRFWTSPMVFAFDPYAGFFAGTLYDTVIDAVPRLVTYRAGSLASLLAAACLCASASTAARGRVRLGRERRGWLGLAALGLSLSLGVTGFGAELGHYQSAR
ncbi:MAG TPA: hypothetical protein VNN80_16890, partial [Polyangiaceae bacterium]|nr:hypothetical protein [Polyangiaceae bacterium]